MDMGVADKETKNTFNSTSSRVLMIIIAAVLSESVASQDELDTKLVMRIPTDSEPRL